MEAKVMDTALKKELQQLLEVMEEILQDRSVPRNIRAVIEEAMHKIDEKHPKGEDFSTAIYLLDDISNDINMPTHTRTDIWESISKMEAIKEKIKGQQM
ncbi:MAG: UPF0147 family protein [Candidatus Diapherotrites archaeon]|uniref:UPF0147 family protein n=1 Tax=Candidatus Iainarchaeum sp. TaxID=3101447 RepID=A0A938YXA4_9ARCH|nr:UPF0147 family protein [Candidatus Diapherotrites archaeon]